MGSHCRGKTQHTEQARDIRLERDGKRQYSMVNNVTLSIFTGYSQYKKRNHGPFTTMATDRVVSRPTDVRVPMGAPRCCCCVLHLFCFVY